MKAQEGALPALPGMSDGGNILAAAEKWRGDLEAIRSDLDTIGAPQDLYDGKFWIAICSWLGGENTKIVVLEELRAYLAWVASKPTRRRDHKAGLRNWLAQSQRWEERREMKEHWRRK